MKKRLISIMLVSTLLSAGEAASCESLNIDSNKSNLQDVIRICTEAARHSEQNEIVMYQLGHAYREKGDYGAAYRWLMKSARLGYPRALRELALMVSLGQGVKKDPALAFKLYLKAMRPDNVRYFYDKGTKTISYSADELLALHSKMTVGSFLEEASRGNRDVYVYLGDAFLNGNYGARKEKIKSFYWFMKAARERDPYAVKQLAKLCLDSVGTQEECDRAFGWNRKLADAGDPEAQYLMGVRYYKGQGVPKDDGVAIEWFQKSAEQHYKGAEYMLAMIYRVKKPAPVQTETKQ